MLRDARQRFNGRLEVEKLGMRVGVHREPYVAVTNQPLSHPGFDACLGQHRGEGVPQRVDIHGPSSRVFLRDARRANVTVEYLDEALWHGEDLHIGRQADGDGLPPVGQRIHLVGGELLRQIVTQVASEVLPKRDVGGPGALRVLAPQQDVRPRLVQMHVAHSETRKLALAKARVNQRPVHEFPLTAKLT
ncbi:MAG: hypothetical protein R6V05_05365 [Candidatus Brocadiia bacterium]